MGNQFGGLSVVSDPSVPDVFADELVAVEVLSGTVRLSFATAKMAEPVTPSALQFVVVGRLIMPLESAQKLALGLFDYLKSAGHDPTALVSGGQTPQ